MVLADKIILLRRRKGWSQEELAYRLGVTRQSISKWEGAQSVPELDKIIKMSEVFGVSCDLLLKDELEPSDSPVAAKQATFADTSTETDTPTEESAAAEEEDEAQEPSCEDSVVDEDGDEGEEEEVEKPEEKQSLAEMILYPVTVIGLVAFFWLGFKINAWSWAWILPTAPFITLIILNSLTDKSGERTALENLGDAVSYTALLIFLLIGLIHNGWAWAWIFPAVSFLAFGIINTVADKSPSETLISKVTTALFGIALLTFLLIGFFHGGWAWAWIIPVGAFVGLTVFRFIVDRKSEKSEEEE